MIVSGRVKDFLLNMYLLKMVNAIIILYIILTKLVEADPPRSPRALEEEIFEIPEPEAVSKFNYQLSLSKERLMSNEESELIMEEVPDIVRKLDPITENSNVIESLETDVFKTPKNNETYEPNTKKWI